MEQDIKILEEYLDKNDRNFISKNKYKLLQAIENLIKRNKELEEENKVWKDNYYEQKEFNNKQALYITDNFIPISLVEERIKEYQNNMKLYENKTHNIFNENNIRQEVITVLQELLEKR